MSRSRTIAAVFLALALALTVVLVAAPSHAATRKPGPVCTVKQAKKHPKRCVIVACPKGAIYPYVGLVVADGITVGAGSQLIAAQWPVDPNLSRSGWSGWNSRTSQSLLCNTASTSSYLRIARSASTIYDFYESPDGVSWVLIGSGTYTITPTRVGFAAGSWEYSGPFATSFAYFRVGS